MMSKFFGRHRKATGDPIDPQALVDQANEINDKLERDGPKLTALATYLERRRLQNGFGTDFEYTLRPRGTS
jgi:hypothetical protein